MNLPTAPSLELRGVSCARHGAVISALDFELSQRGFHVLTGENGAHELLLRLLGLLEIPDSGAVHFRSENTSALDDAGRAALRTTSFAYAFAAPFLLPSLTVIENLAMPLFKLMETSPSDARTRAENLLEFVGLGGHEEERAGDLPPPLQYAAALARALITQPEVLIVEGLDRNLTGSDLAHYTALLRQVVTRMGVTVICSASPAWQAGPGDHVLEVSESSVRAAVPVVAS